MWHGSMKNLRRIPNLRNITNVTNVTNATNNIKFNSNGTKLIVTDIAGTVQDKFSKAPTVAMVKAFKRLKIQLLPSEGRKYMGLPKHPHLMNTLAMPEIQTQLKALGYPNGVLPEEKVEELKKFLGEELSQAIKEPTHHRVIPGVIDAFKILRSGSFGKVMIVPCTGYYTEHAQMMEKYANAQGLYFDLPVVSSDQVKNPRPFGGMILKIMKTAGITNHRNVIKIDDTVAGLKEGIDAGVATMGVYGTSVYMNIDSDAHEAEVFSNPNLVSQREMDAKQQLEPFTSMKFVRDFSEVPAAIWENDIYFK